MVPSDLSASVVEPPTATFTQLVSIPMHGRNAWVLTLLPSPNTCQPNPVSPQVQRLPSETRITPWLAPIATAGLPVPVGNFQLVCSEKRSARIIKAKTTITARITAAHFVGLLIIC